MARRHAALAAAVALFAVGAASSATTAAAAAPSCTAVYSTQLVKTEFAPGAADAPTARPVPSSFVARGHVVIQSADGAPLDGDARVTIDFGHGVELASQEDEPAAAPPASSAPLFVPTESSSPSLKSFAVVPPPSAARAGSLEASSEGPPDAVALSYELSSPNTDFAPRGVSVDGAPCAVASAGAAVPPSPPSDARSLRSPIPGLSFLEEKPVSTRGDLFIGVDGLPFTIKGINWFGFENGQTNPDGLWGNVSDSIVADFVNVVWRMQLLGFNTVRLPFSFRDLESAVPKDPKYATCHKVTPELMAASVTPPGVAAPAAATMPVSKNPIPATRNYEVCNDYVPMDSQRNRFFWAMRYIASNGFYVVIDDHLAYDTLVLDDTAKWVASWQQLAADIAKDPVLRPRVMLDLLNEPDARGIKWTNGPKGPTVGMATYYEQAMDAIYKVHPTALMLLEGTGQLGTVAMNWGDGFATDAAVVAAGHVDDARPFFEKMMTKPYVNNIVISPHIYPPSISTHNEPEVVLAPGLFSRLDASFGYLTKRGFCPAGVAQPTPAQLAAAVPGVPASPGCKTFPVVYGETGSKFDRALDVQMLDDFAKYMTSSTPGHNPTPNMIWWSWNANSGDTGGIVADNWKDVQWHKVAWLQKAAGLQPWALGLAGKLPGAAGPSPVMVNGVPSAYGANSMFDQSGGKPAAPVPAAPVPAAPVPAAPVPAAPSCVDKATPDGFSCEQQRSWGKCSADWFAAAGFCQRTCGKCPPPAAAPKPKAVEEIGVPAEAAAAAAAAAAVPAAVPAAAPLPPPAPVAVPASAAAVEGAPELPPLAAAAAPAPASSAVAAAEGSLVAPIAPAPASSAFPATVAAQSTAANTKAMLRDAGAASLKAGKADATLADAAQIARILESASGAASDDATLAAAASVLEGRSQAHVAAVVAQLRAAAAIEAVMEASVQAAGSVDEAALFGAAKAAAAEALLE